MTARLLFASKRANPEIQVAVAYLCTSVKEPNELDYHKLTRLMKYLSLMVHLPLLISWNKFSTLTWSVNAFVAMHKDMRITEENHWQWVWNHLYHHLLIKGSKLSVPLKLNWWCWWCNKFLWYGPRYSLNGIWKIMISIRKTRWLMKVI